jgi:hypothetical protein
LSRSNAENAENAGLPDDVSAIALATVEVSGVFERWGTPGNAER